MNKKYVLVEFENSCPFVQKFVSKDEIPFEKIVEHFIENEDFNKDKDSITVVNDPEDGSIEI